MASVRTTMSVLGLQRHGSDHTSKYFIVLAGSTRAQEGEIDPMCGINRNDRGIF